MPPLWALAPAAAALCLALSMTCAALAEWRDIRSLQAAAGIFFLAAAGVTGVSAVALLWGRRWVAAAFLLVLFPVIFIGGAVGLLVSSIAGRALGLRETGPSMLPIPSAAIQDAGETGRRLAALLSASTGTLFEWSGVRLSFDGRGREAAFDFSAQPPSNLHAGLRFRQRGDGSWENDGWSSSGDPELHKQLRPALDAALRGIPLAGWTWPVEPETENRLLEAGRSLAAAFAGLPLAPASAPWELARVEFRHFPRWENPNAVVLACEARQDKTPTAWAWPEFRFDGSQLWLRSTIADRAGSSTREDSAMAESALREWIGEGRDPFRVSGSDRGWRECSADLGEGVRLVYQQRSAHPFLAEYEMRVLLSGPQEATRRFVLPVNTGGRTQVLVFEGQAPS
ncbi:MAG: hypothetical protein N2322_07080, partial [Terrimicrobiaceae bacterium]|nr:hypothetical protein [Terrimicrobiaceae bacterium]